VHTCVDSHTRVASFLRPISQLVLDRTLPNIGKCYLFPLFQGFFLLQYISYMSGITANVTPPAPRYCHIYSLCHLAQQQSNIF
jgi:hypothetical protein